MTRDIIKRHGRDSKEFAKIAIVVLNQVIRPFIAKWHKLSLAGAFKEQKTVYLFSYRIGTNTKKKLRIYTKMLADMAGVEDLTSLEETN